MTFKQFSIHYLEFLSRMWLSGPEGKKAVAHRPGHPRSRQEQAGCPSPTTSTTSSTRSRRTSSAYDFSSKRAKRAFIADTLGLGDDVADVRRRAASAAHLGLPIDVSMRMGMGNLIPMTGILLRSNTDRSKDVAELGGAAGAFGQSVFKGAAAALRGDYADAVGSVIPMALQNMVKAAEMWNTGEYRNAKGDTVMHVGAGDALAKAIGFQPADVAKATAVESDITRSEQLAKNVRTEIAQKWEQGLKDNKPEVVAEARTMLREWNEANPEEGLRISMQSIINAVRRSNLDRAQRLVKNAPAGMRPFVRDQLNAP
jgi:hypothetical protein